MFKKIQECCLQCFHCCEKEKDDYKKYDETKNTINNEEFEKLLDEIIIIQNDTEIKNEKLDHSQDSENEDDYIFC